MKVLKEGTQAGGVDLHIEKDLWCSTEQGEERLGKLHFDHNVVL